MSGPWDDPRVAAGLDRLFRTRAAALASGAVGVGWKVGFGAPASLELMEIDAPLLGYLTDRSVLPSGATVPVGEWSRGIVEFEVAAYMGADVPGGATPEEARRAVAALAPAIELADIDLPVESANVAEIVAGNIFHQAVIFGERDPDRTGIELAGITARILVDGDEISRVTDLQALTGDYPGIVATVAATLAAKGEMLAAGDVIITGSVIPPVPVSDGTEFTLALDPFPSISVVVEG